MAETAANEFFVVGGTLGRDAACYVRRQADEDLLAALRGGNFCYVLTSRQMGKSSLMVRAAVALRAQGDTRVAVLDLTALGQNLTPEQWYRGLATRAAQQFGLRREVEEYWAAHADASPLERWMGVLREVVLERLTERVVIFVDEIDATRSVPFVTDEFFAAIRELYNRRAEDPALQRITFCLIGVATPSDLIQDARTTPFNVGTRIDLTDFSEAESAALLPGLGRPEDAGRVLIERILYWTGGHPYMTQRLCLAVADDPSVEGTAGVDRVCEDLFLSARARERDDNLLFVRDRILRSESDHAALLMLYDRVRKHERLRDDPSHPLISILRLSGIIRVREGFLFVRNRIYFRVFDREWVRANLPLDEVARQKAAYRRGVIRVARMAIPVCLILLGLAIYAVHEERNAKNIANTAVEYVNDSTFAVFQQASNDPDLMSKLTKSYFDSSYAFNLKMASELGNTPQANDDLAFGLLISGAVKALQIKTDSTAQAAAIKNYQSAVNYATKAKSLDRKNERAYVLLYAIYNQMGLLYQGQKDYANASKTFLQSVQAAQDLVHVHDYGKSEDDLQSAELQMGIASYDEDHRPEALQYYQASLEAAKKASADKQYDDDPWISYEQIGLFYQDEGDTAKASDAFVQSEQTAQDLIHVHDNAKSEDHLANTEIHRGAIADSQGQSQQAVQFYQTALAAARKAAAADPTYDDDLWVALDNLASEQDGKAADYAGAQKTYADELNEVEAAFAKAAGPAQKTKLQTQLIQTYGNLAWAELLAKQYPEALSDAKALLKMDPTQDWMEVNLAHAYLFMGQLQTAESVYFNNPNRKLPGGDETFAETALGDFKQFRAMKMVPPGMDSIEQKLEVVEKLAAPAAKTSEAPAASPPAPTK